MSWKLKKFAELSLMELYAILQLRAEVFVVEQTCAYQDMDGKDEQCHHFFYEEHNKLQAYVRLVPPGLSYESPAIGRVLTAGSARGKGLGRELMQRAIQECQALYHTTEITISAQLYLERFYAELGFVRVSDVYPEDDIPHIKMKLHAKK